MHTYEIETEAGKLGLKMRRRIITSMEEVAEELEKLPVQAFFAIIVNPPIKNVDMLKIMLLANTKGFFKKVPIPPEYSIDVVLKDETGDEKEWYMSEILTYEDLYAIVADFVERQQLPQYEDWLDATKDMLG